MVDQIKARMASRNHKTLSRDTESNRMRSRSSVSPSGSQSYQKGQMKGGFKVALKHQANKKSTLPSMRQYLPSHLQLPSPQSFQASDEPRKVERALFDKQNLLAGQLAGYSAAQARAMSQTKKMSIKIPAAFDSIQPANDGMPAVTITYKNKEPSPKPPRVHSTGRPKVQIEQDPIQAEQRRVSDLMRHLKAKQNPGFSEQLREELNHIRQSLYQSHGLPTVTIPSSLSHSKSGEITSGLGRVIDQSVFDVMPSNGGYKGPHSIYEEYQPPEIVESQEQVANQASAIQYAQILQGHIDSMKKRQDWRTRKLLHNLSQNHLNA